MKRSKFRRRTCIGSSMLTKHRMKDAYCSLLVQHQVKMMNVPNQCDSIRAHEKCLKHLPIK